MQPVRLVICTVFTAAVCAASASTAGAQSPASRVVVSLDALAQLTTSDVQQTVTFEQFSEQGALKTTYVVPRGFVYGGGLAVRLWRDVGVGVAADHMSDAGTAQVSGSVPDPFAFTQPHTFKGTVPVGRSETAIHLDAAFWPYRSPRIDVRVEGGPSFIRVDQDFVSDVQYSQPPPYTSVSYEGATVVRERRNVVGANVAADVTWRFTPHIGAAAVVRFSRAHALFADSGAPELIAGGLHAGAGLRLSF